MKPTQCGKVLRHLKDHGRITAAEAISEYGCYRLAARIADLKARGWPIRQRMITGTNRYGEATRFAEYYFEED